MAVALITSGLEKKILFYLIKHNLSISVSYTASAELSVTGWTTMIKRKGKREFSEDGVISGPGIGRVWRFLKVWKKMLRAILLP